MSLPTGDISISQKFLAAIMAAGKDGCDCTACVILATFREEMIKGAMEKPKSKRSN